MKIFTIIWIVCLLLAGCGPSAKQMTATAVMAQAQTQTAAPTLTPTFTPTLTLTPTRTRTPTPSVTWTPAVTPTQLPLMTPPSKGLGNVVGLVLWNGEPVPDSEVWLCLDWDYGYCKGKVAVNTDKKGYYLFRNVTPGEYIVAMNSFDTSWFLFYFNSRNEEKQSLRANQTLTLDPWHIYKFTLKTISPYNAETITQTKTTLKWEAFPDAAYYRVWVYYVDAKNYIHWIDEEIKVNGTEFQTSPLIYTCKYYWKVMAFNDQDIPISQTIPPGSDWNKYFFVTGKPINCQ